MIEEDEKWNGEVGNEKEEKIVERLKAKKRSDILEWI
jgi:hypothetical protein